eukprot:SAG11_NODE_2754_length_3007_cov_10.651307_5_plen_180_part_00
MPIDAHRRAILAHIGAHRVTIIQDETGCGKSSRLPQMLLDYGGSEVRKMVAQPRRLAAHSLLQRARQSLPPERRHLVRMRMGHGVRDEESGTRLWYVMTGYLGEGLVARRQHPHAGDGQLLCVLCHGERGAGGRGDGIVSRRQRVGRPWRSSRRPRRWRAGPPHCRRMAGRCTHSYGCV